MGFRSVAISGLAGAGKSSLARELAKALNFKLFSVGAFFRELAKEAGMSIEEYMKVAKEELHKKVDSKVKELAKEGGWVLEGRLTCIMAGKHAYKIFLKAPVEVRAARIAGRENISLEEAIRLIRERDRIDVENYRKIYGIYVLNMGYYDLVFDNTYFSVEEEVKLLLPIIKLALKL